MMARVPGGLVVLVGLCSAVSVAVAALPLAQRLKAPDLSQYLAALPSDSQTAPQNARQNAPRIDLSPILDFAPFGRSAPSVTASADPEAAPLVDLKLQGISASPNDLVSRAIIAAGDGPAASYAIGDAVAPSVRLTAIAADHVTISIGGHSQRLDFPVTSALLTPVAAEPTGSAMLQNLIQQVTPAPDGISATIAALRDDLLRNPQAVLARHGIAATDEGYVIGDDADDALIQAGLLPGDLISTINGRRVGDILQDRGFLDEVAALGQADIVAVRAGQPIALSVPLQ